MTGTLLVTLSSPDWPSDVRVFVAVFLAQMDTQVDAVLQAALLTTTSKVPGKGEDAWGERSSARGGVRRGAGEQDLWREGVVGAGSCPGFRCAAMWWLFGVGVLDLGR